DALERASRDADPRDRARIAGQSARGGEPDRDARRPLEKVPPAVPLRLRLWGGRQRILAAFTQIVHSNLLHTSDWPDAGPERISEPHLHSEEASGAILGTCMQRFQVSSELPTR